jgi:DNA sulfur modification protein DndB
MSSTRGRNIRIENVQRFTRRDDEGNSLVYYTGLMSSDIAKDATYVPVMKNLVGNKSPLIEKGNGYQRPGSGPRMRTFARYLRDHPVAIVPPVLLSTRDKWTFIESEYEDFGDLEVRGPAAIIDGQHRLGGFISLFDTDEIVLDIDFIAYEGLSATEEAQVFNTINGNAKGVPKGLGKAIEGSWSTQVAIRLNEDSGSPFFGHFFYAGQKEVEGASFNLSSIDKEVKRTFSHGSFSALVEAEDIDTMYDIMQRYWDLIAEHFPVEWEDIYEKRKDQEYKLLELTGIIAWSAAATDLLGPNYDPNIKEMYWEKVRELLSQIAESGLLDLRKNGEFQNATGGVGGPMIHRKIQRILAQTGH